MRRRSQKKGKSQSRRQAQRTTAKARQKGAREDQGLSAHAGVVGARTFSETAPTKAAARGGSQPRRCGAVGAHQCSQAHRHNSGDNGFPVQKGRRGKARAKEERGKAQKAKEKDKEEATWVNCGRHRFGGHPLDRYNTSPMTRGRSLEALGAETFAWYKR